MYKTTNLQLNQFERSDYFNIDLINENNSIIDREITKLIKENESLRELVVHLGQQIDKLIDSEINQVEDSSSGA